MPNGQVVSLVGGLVDEVADRVDRDLRRHLAVAVAAHAVGHDVELVRGSISK